MDAYNYVTSLFNRDNPNIILEEINGEIIPTLEMSDSHGNYIAIPALNKNFANICGQFICGHMIKEIDYDSIEEKTVIIKAYY